MYIYVSRYIILVFLTLLLFYIINRIIVERFEIKLNNRAQWISYPHFVSEEREFFSVKELL